MKKILVGTNTKMYKTIAKTTEYLQKLEQLTRDIPNDRLTLFVIPSYTSLPEAARLMSESRILIGAQNMGWEDEGQFTGEVSPLMLKEINTDLVMIGHSERRHVLHETDYEENKKVLKSLQHGFTTLLCVGETATEQSFGIADEVLAQQLKIGLFGVTQEQLSQLWIAYEPVWAIGTQGKPATAEYAQCRHAKIKAVLQELFGSGGSTVPVLYGGSVNPQNAEEFMKCPGVDGLFIGRSAWEAVTFNVLIRQILHVTEIAGI